MLFEENIGEIIFTPIKKLLRKPIEEVIYVVVSIFYILTFLANTNTPHDKLLDSIKIYFAKWSLFITTWDSFIIKSISLTIFGLILIFIVGLVINTINNFQYINLESINPILENLCCVYIAMSMLYAGMIILVEPSFSSFYLHINKEYYGELETASILIGFTITVINFILHVINFLKNKLIA